MANFDKTMSFKVERDANIKVKEILKGNSYWVLAEEEKDAHNEALNSKKEKK